MLSQLVKVKGIEWIRLHYAFPAGFPKDVLDVINNEEKICNYIDIPLQHINSDILKSMRRGTTFKKTNKLLDIIRDSVSNIAIRTTLIVGYPGETKNHFNELKKWVATTKFDRLGVFTYSHEENTHAFKLKDDVDQETKQSRLNELMELQSTISYELNQKKVGKIFKVLIDRKEGKYFVGRTEFDSPEVDNEVFINAANSYLRIGDFSFVKITHADTYDLFGYIV